MFLAWNPNVRKNNHSCSVTPKSWVMGMLLPVTVIAVSELSSVSMAWASSPYSLRELSQVEKGNDSQIRALRDEEIQQLRIALGRRLPANRKADLYFRLAEIYLEAYHSTFLLEGRVHDARVEKGLDDTTVNRDHSKPYLERGIEACLEILHYGIRYDKLDRIYYFLGFYYQELNQAKQGVPYYLKLIQEYPRSPFVGIAHKEVGEYEYRSAEYRRATEHLEQAMKMVRPEQIPGIFHKIAWCRYRTREFDQAIDKMKELIGLCNRDLKQFEPLKVEALRDLATFFTERGRVEEAVRYFEAESGDKKLYPTLLEKLGKQFEHNAQADKAELVYETLIKNSPESDSALKAFLKLVELDIKRDRFDAVIRRLKNFSSFEASGPDAQAALQNLKVSFRKIAVDHHQAYRKKNNKHDLEVAKQFYQAYRDHFIGKEDPHQELPEIEMYLAEVCHDLGQDYEAVELYRKVIASKDSRYAIKAAALWTGGLADLMKAAPPRSGAVDPSPLEREFVVAADQLRATQGQTDAGRGTSLRIAKVLAGYQSSRPEAIQRIKEIIQESPDSKEAVVAAQLWIQIYMDHPHEEALPGQLADVFAAIRKSPELLRADHRLNQGQLQAALDHQELKSKVDRISQQEKSQDYLGAGQGYETFAAETQDRALAEKAFTNAINSYLKTDQSAEAVSRVLEVWHRRFPNSPKALEPLRSVATHALIVGNFDLSISLFQKLGTEYREADSLETAALLGQAIGEDRRAQSLWGDFLARNPRSPRRAEIELVLARSQEKSGLDGEASRSYRACAGSGQSVSAECQARLADLYLKSQDIGKAKGLLKELAAFGSSSKGRGSKKKSSASLSPFVGYARYLLADLMEKEASFEPMKFPEAQLKKGLSQRLNFLEPLSKAYQGAVEVGGPWGIAALHRLSLWATQFADDVDAIEAPPTLQGAGLERFKKQLFSVSQPLREKARSTWSDAYSKASAQTILSPVLPEISDHLADFKSGSIGRAQGPRLKLFLSGTPANGGTEGALVALGHVREGLLKDAKSPSLWIDYGNLLWGEGKPLLAKIAYQRSLALQPKNATALNNLAVVILNSEGAEDWLAANEAAARLDQALQVDDFFAPAKTNLASLMNYYRLFGKAKALWDQVRVRHPGGTADLGLAVALQGLGKNQAAESIFQKNEEGPDQIFVMHYHRAGRESIKGTDGARECENILRRFDDAQLIGFEKQAVSYLMKRCESWRK